MSSDNSRKTDHSSQRAAKQSAAESISERSGNNATAQLKDNRAKFKADQQLSKNIGSSLQLKSAAQQQRKIDRGTQASNHSSQTETPLQMQPAAEGTIQLEGGYEISEASDSGSIGEQEVGSGDSITFTKFSSCIGIVGKKGDGSLVGIHLVRFGGDGEPFQLSDVPTVKASLSGVSDIQIIGMTDFWGEDILTAIGGTVVPGSDGVYSANTDESGKIVVTKVS